MKAKSKFISMLTAAALSAASFAGLSASALEYGSEWGGRNQESDLGKQVTVTVTQAPAAVAAPAAEEAAPEEEIAVTEAPAPVTQTITVGTYNDVPTSHWAFKAIETCSDAHWFDGYVDGTFRPNGEILRAEAMKVFVKILGLPLSDVTNPTYYDVGATAWYAPYVEAGQFLFPEMTAPDGSKKFQPEMPITREVAIYALVKTLGYDSEVRFVDESKLNMFSDQKSISTNIRPYMAWAINDGLASGYDDGTIGAQEPLTRAEFATILYRANITHGFNNTGFVAKVTSGITIDPSTLKEITVGESFEITAAINYSDGTSEDYTNKLNPYTDSEEGIVTINKNKVTGVGEGTVLINYNADDEAAKSQTLVVNVKPDPNAATEEPTAEPTAEPTPEPVQADTAAVIKANVDKEKVAAAKTKRYSVLVMDTSGSMYGSRIEEAKAAANSFCSTVMGAGGDDYIAIVEFGVYSSVLCDFTNDLSTLKDSINRMKPNGTTNMYGGMADAEALLDAVTDSGVTAKSLIVMTDGAANEGATEAGSRYTSEYFNALYTLSRSQIAKGYDIYSVGFSTMGSTEQLLKDIQNKGFYKANIDGLEAVFKNIADTIVVAGVNVKLYDGEMIVDSCSTTEGACDFSFTVNPGTYKLEISAPGYKTRTEDITLASGETKDLGSIVLALE